MISIGKYLRLPRPPNGFSTEELFSAEANELDKALVDLSRGLLRAVEQYSVAGERAEFEQFQRDLREAAAPLNGELSPESALAVGREFGRVVEAHRARVEGFQRAQNAELQAMISMLSQTLVMLASSAQRSTANLQEIGKQMEKTCVLDDLVVLRGRLQDCLSSLQEETARQRRDSTNLVRHMEQELQRAQERIALVSAGLPGRSDAEQILAEAHRNGRPCFAVVLAVERYRSISSRFGLAVMDEILRSIAQQLLHLAGDGQLFRWNAGVLLALVERKEGAADIEAEIRKMVAAPFERKIEVGDRTALLSIAAVWLVLPVFEAPSAETLFDRIDSFVAEQV